MKNILLLVIIMMLSSLTSCKDNSVIMAQTSTPAVNDEINNMITIDLKGEVVFPNLYSVKEGVILYELLMLAGGLTSEADITGINLVQELSTNQTIIIPKKNTSVKNYNDNNKININTAPIELLTTLPGIGTSKAHAIIEYRKNNVFKRIDEIKNVNGIGDELYIKIKDLICV